MNGMRRTQLEGTPVTPRHLFYSEDFVSLVEWFARLIPLGVFQGLWLCRNDAATRS